MANSPIIFGANGATNIAPVSGLYNADGSVARYDGAKNFIPQSTFANGVVTGWSLFNTTLTSGLPTGSITLTAGSLTAAMTTTNPLRVSESANNLQVVAASAWTAGQGIISSAFTVDREDLGKVLSARFAYEVVSGAANANWSGLLGSQTLGVYLYDVTASAWLQPAGFLGMNQSANPASVAATFQSSVVSGQQYQVAVLALQATASPVTVNFNNFSCGPVYASQGPVVSDWQAATVTGTWVSNTTYSAFEKRIGDAAHYQVQVTLSGAPTNAGLNITIPRTIDTTKLTANPQSVFGTANAIHAATNYAFEVVYNSSNSVTLVWQNGIVAPTQTGVNATTPFTWATGDTITMNFEVPVMGWSSVVQLSNDTDTRVVSLRATKGSTQAVTANVTNITFTTVVKDSHGGWNGTDTYTTRVSGDYWVGTTLADVGSNSYVFNVYINGSLYTQVGASAAGLAAPGGALVPGLKAGDLITVRANATQTVNVGNLTIFRLSGPSVVAATESINARYTASTSTVTGTPATVIFSTKSFDSHNAYSTSTGLYTVPVSGKYAIMSSIGVTGSGTASKKQSMYIYLNGALYSVIQTWGATGPVTFFSTTINDLVSCNAGDTLAIWLANDGTTPAITTNPGQVFINFSRIGN